MIQLVFFLEEQSAKEMLEGLLPRMLNKDVRFQCISFEGKQDLEKQLGKRLRNWCDPNAFFIVLRDQDSADCITVKQRLVKICQTSGKPNTLVRIVCRELESWYLGDLQAVEKGLGMTSVAKHQRNSKFRNPDRLQNPKQELKKLTKNNYQQILGSREIGRHMALEHNLSTSFNAFISGVVKILNQETC
ncbi:MAG: hypothetical protein ACI9D5_000328 [Candidatus Endobugula sp.]|jgi:hypothetical protein